MTKINLLGLLWMLAAIGIAQAQGRAPTEEVVYSFTQPTGYYPAAGVIGNSAGTLYGTTVYGGTANGGVVYKLDTSGYTVLYNFPGGVAGSQPYGGVIRDAAGNLYGTTRYGGGGDANMGVVYKLDTAGQETVLHKFTGGADGGETFAGVVRDQAGNLYGTTTSGGTGGAGVVYKVDTANQYTVLHSFTGGADGGFPKAGVILDPSGNLYGDTNSGGTDGAGVVYKLDNTGQERVLYSFTGADGAGPYGGVILDPGGNIYGTTLSGGSGVEGVVYKLNTAGQETVLHNFTGGTDGGSPLAGVTLGPAGNLYGTTEFGGTDGQGVVYELDTTGHETVLHSFTGGADGGEPFAGVTLGPAGALYGTTSAGGSALQGVVFKVIPR